MFTYSPSLIANAFLYKARQTGAQLSHLKLQKLVFFVHAWGLALKGKSPVQDSPQAWPYGPVFESLYHELKGFGSKPVDSYLLQMNPQSGKLEPQIPVQTDTDFWALLGQVWDRYSTFSAVQLSALTHESGGPWEKARQGQVLSLTDDAVRDYYRGKLQHGG